MFFKKDLFNFHHPIISITVLVRDGLFSSGIRIRYRECYFSSKWLIATQIISTEISYTQMYFSLSYILGELHGVLIWVHRDTP